MQTTNNDSVQKGFTLVETVIALGILAVGILSMAAMLSTCVALMDTSRYDYIAQQKALEAVESIFTARDLQQASWANINNTTSGGIFLAGAQELCAPGPDGIVGTADDDCTKPDYIATPNSATGFMETTPTIASNGDVTSVLSTFKRTITISPVAGETDLRAITVLITYQVGTLHRTYQLTTEISQYS